MQNAFADVSPEIALAWCVVLGMSVVGLWRLLAWWLRAPAKPDPWETEAVALGDPSAADPLCLHCLEPHPDTAWFCPHCGAPVGDFNNYSPYLYVFTVGEVLRTGTSGRFPRNWVTLSGYFLVSVTEYLVLAPLYWVFLILNLRRPTPPPPLPPPALS
jgi:hypothetical protein